MENLKKLIEFKERYGDLHDSLIKRVDYSLNESNVSVEIACCNQDRDNLVLYFTNIEEFIFKEINTTNQVIYEATFATLNGNLVFDFSPYSLGSEKLEDFRRSHFVIHCKGFNYMLKPN